MDRRSEYTIKEIKSAFLIAIADKEYSALRVSDICRIAQIHRSTFYLHFYSIDNLLDNILDDIFESVQTMFDEFEGVNNDTCRYPLCRFIREQKQYRAIFLDRTLSDYIVSKLSNRYKDVYVRQLSEKANFNFKDAESIFWFQIHGCYSLTIHNINKSNDEWESIKKQIDSFIQRGIYEK